MKIFCLLLSLSVLLLSTVPCCDDNCDEEQISTEQTENHDDVENCSPFLTCGVCTGFVSLYNMLDIQPAEEVNNIEMSRPTVLFVDNCFTTIWQPPKIVNT